MKKSKFLIPALSIASVGAVVAPMVTSCAKSNGIGFDIIVDSDPQEYKPMTPGKASEYQFEVDSSEWPTWTEEEKTEGVTKDVSFDDVDIAYARAVQANPNILADDIINGVVENLPSSNMAALKTLSLAVKNISITELHIDGDIVPLYSCDMSLHAVEESDEEVVDINVRYNRIPMTMTFNVAVDDTSATYPTIGAQMTIKDIAAILSSGSAETIMLAQIAYDTEQAIANFSYDVDYKRVEKDGTIHTDVHSNISSFVQMLGLTQWASDEELLAPFFSAYDSNYFSKAVVTKKA